jgi:hypothetical protein
VEAVSWLVKSHREMPVNDTASPGNKNCRRVVHGYETKNP